MVDSASQLEKTWRNLSYIQSTDRVLGAFEGQPIKHLDYFLTPVSQEDDTSKSAILPFHVS